VEADLCAGLQATSRIKMNKFLSKNFGIGTFFYDALFFKISLASSIQSLKKSSHLKEKSRQSIVKLITNGMAMNCWEFSVIRVIRSQSAQGIDEDTTLFLRVSR